MANWPNMDVHGRPVKEGDLVLLCNDGTDFVAYLDSKSNSGVRHAALTKQGLNVWAAAPNWSAMRLLCRDAEFGLGAHPKPMPPVVDQNRQHGGAESLE